MNITKICQIYKLHLERKKSPGDKLKLTSAYFTLSSLSLSREILSKFTIHLLVMASKITRRSPNVLSDFLLHYFLCTLTIMQNPASRVYASIMGDQSSLSWILQIPRKPLEGWTPFIQKIFPHSVFGWGRWRALMYSTTPLRAVRLWEMGGISRQCALMWQGPTKILELKWKQLIRGPEIWATAKTLHYNGLKETLHLNPQRSTL